jgi:hypothetical protein
VAEPFGWTRRERDAASTSRQCSPFIVLLVAALTVLFLMSEHRGSRMREPARPIPSATTGAGNGAGGGAADPNNSE